MSATPSFTRNDELFGAFYALQARVTDHLARHPAAIKAWLDGQPARLGSSHLASGPPKSWRTARLSTARRLELAALVTPAPEPRAGALAQWLLSAVPVRLYLEIADAARPSLKELDAPADACCRELARCREDLFMANYGLAKRAACYGPSQDFDDRVSAASCGLLDAIDRYVPGAKSARFSYFASYWIRYHLARLSQKSGAVVATPVHQHRVSRRIDRYIAEHGSQYGAHPSEAKICAELKLGSDACYWHRHRPRFVSIDAPADWNVGFETEQMVNEEVSAPGFALDEADAIENLRAYVRSHFNPATRMMLAYTRGIGDLVEASKDYLVQMQEAALAQLEGAVRGLHREAGR